MRSADKQRGVTVEWDDGHSTTVTPNKLKVLAADTFGTTPRATPAAPPAAAPSPSASQGRSDGRPPSAPPIEDQPRRRPLIGDLIPASVEEANDRRDEVEALLRQELEPNDYASYRVEITNVETTFGMRPSVSFDATIAKDGEMVGMVSRAFNRENDGTMWAYHDTIALGEEHQGKGFSSAWNEYLEDWYVESGLDHIELVASFSGAYVWARNAYAWYDADQPGQPSGETKRFKPVWKLGAEVNRLARLIDDHDAGTVSAEARLPDDLLERERRELAQARDLLERFRLPFDDPQFPQPINIASIGWSPERKPDRERDPWLGYRVMFDSSWRGIKWLPSTPVSRPSPGVKADHALPFGQEGSPMSVTLEYKAVAPLAPVWGITADDEEGTFTALVAVTGVKDNVNDVIVPGAFAGTLIERTPKGVHSHDDEQWTARTLIAEELMPGDPRLPRTTRDGKAWPRAAGAVYIKGQFNLATKQGRDAYENVKFFKEQCEWSIGYAVIPGRSKRDSKGVRHIHELALYEYSTVLVAANPLAMTLSVKSQFGRGATIEVTDPVPAPAAREVGTYDVRIHIPEGLNPEEIGRKAAQLLRAHGIGGRLVKTDDAPEQSHAQGDDRRPGAMIALKLPADVADAVALDDGVPVEELHVTLAYIGKGLTPEQLTAAEGAARSAAGSVGPLAGIVGGLGAFPEGEDGVPVWAPVDVPGLEVLRQRVVDALQDAGAPVALNHGYTPHITRVYLTDGDPLPEPLGPIPVQFHDLEFVVGGESTRIPLGGAAPAETAGTETKSARLDLMLRAAGLPLPLSYEEIADRIRTAMRQWLYQDGTPPEDQAWIYTTATFPRVAVVSAERHGSIQTWQVPYIITPVGGVVLGDPQSVEVDVSVPGGQESAVVEQAVDHMAVLTKSLQGTLGGGEVKAGQVLSGVNFNKLLAAYSAIGDVLKSSGHDPEKLRGDDRPEAEPMPAEAPIQPDSTAPSARPTGFKSAPLGEGMTTLTAEELFEGLAIVAYAGAS
uniref:GNAT family N-acetyltransferase n=1 Tax=Streptosporangium sp. CA-235898 TaxID=3240073 RepID=UPI003F495FB4